jgi:Fic family protein
MQAAIIFLAGFTLGGLVIRRLMMSAQRRSMRTHERDGQYRSATHAALGHMRVRGTLNGAELERMMDIPAVTALRYLDQMVHDGILKAHGHRDHTGFYTLA